MNGLGLSAAAIEARRKYIQAGNAADIMEGRWGKVYREKMGLAEDPDFWDGMPWFIKRHVSREQMDLKRIMGQYSEPLNLAYCEQQTGREIQYYSGSTMLRDIWRSLTGREAYEQELQVSKHYPFMACNLDSTTTTTLGHRAVIDAKHVGQRVDERMILRYTAAGVHQATVMDCDWWALSVFIGNGKWELIEQEVDPFYQADLIARCREFWSFVERGEEPEDRGEPTLPPKPAPKRRTIDVPINIDDPVFAALMRRENWLPEMVEAMGVFASTDAAAKRHAIARKDMDRLMPEDVGLVTRGSIKAKRDGRGFTASLSKEKTDD
jgi:hypothetical protein